ncbi:hypothetical protein BCO26_0970 [Heyndrickxia coagulans 2-6]|nr:hypothetical protein BCO26_0970 [Heyndrickxia coagulans 2-6]
MYYPSTKWPKQNAEGKKAHRVPVRFFSCTHSQFAGNLKAASAGDAAFFSSR